MTGALAWQVKKPNKKRFFWVLKGEMARDYLFILPGSPPSVLWVPSFPLSLYPLTDTNNVASYKELKASAGISSSHNINTSPKGLRYGGHSTIAASRSSTQICVGIYNVQPLSHLEKGSGQGILFLSSQCFSTMVSGQGLYCYTESVFRIANSILSSALRHVLQLYFVNDMVTLVRRSILKENFSGHDCLMNENEWVDNLYSSSALCDVWTTSIICIEKPSFLLGTSIIVLVSFNS
ncbi:hypothetical protein NC652_038923 [Populus alba x Populus x berolinensis]|nr:hypothetical protein NC652_038923 [Populus alba x Populus x berolinensis]